MRSPNYPAIGLPEAIGLVRTVWDAERRTELSAQQLSQVLGYKSLSGASRAVIAALKKYGLLSENGDKLRVSERSVALLHKPKITREYKQAVRDAIGGIELFTKLLQTHPDASANTIKTHLIVDHGFTEEGAKRFYDSFASSLTLDQPQDSSNNGTGEQGKPADDVAKKVRAGDMVQWVSQGAMQFPEPKRVQGLSPDADYVFVEGSETGISIGEVSVVQAAPDVPNPPTGGIAAAGPANPHFRQAANVTSTTFPLSHGSVLLQWPTTLTADDLQDLKDWLAVAQRKIERSVQLVDE